MKTICTEEMKAMLLFIADRVMESKPMLTEVDSRIGDGDHGIGMETGFRAVKEVLSGEDFDTVNQLFRQTGIAMLNSMGGASGVVFSTMFMGGVKGMQDTSQIDTQAFADMMSRSLEAVQKRGGARRGDKTMVDALEPACAAMSEYQGGDFGEIFCRAAEAAQKGVEETKRYAAKFGRAKSLMERSIGYQDAGATSVWIIFRAAADWCLKKEAEEA